MGNENNIDKKHFYFGNHGFNHYLMIYTGCLTPNKERISFTIVMLIKILSPTFQKSFVVEQKTSCKSAGKSELLTQINTISVIEN